MPFAVREPLPGTDLETATPRPGIGVSLWLHADGAEDLHDQLAAAGVPIASSPADGPFGRMFTFLDPTGMHSRSTTEPDDERAR